MLMPMVRSKTDGDAGGMAHSAAVARAPGRLLRRVGWTAIALCTGSALLLALGFLWFIWRLPADEVALDRNADGIVVLTGGASRIADAIELLAAGHGRRLLISGANRSTNTGEISRLNPEFERVVRCCVDFDRSLNTLGNAIETRRWAERRGFRSLIVVTSNYHMPRAMAEIGHQLPSVALIPFPVLSDRMRSEPWWTSGATMKLMLSEYLKYMFAHIRIRLNPQAGATATG
jgi:uncharacterized SAM-binding protein YcdF (DUF218 family)